MPRDGDVPPRRWLKGSRRQILSQFRATQPRLSSKTRLYFQKHTSIFKITLPFSKTHFYFQNRTGPLNYNVVVDLIIRKSIFAYRNISILI